MTAPLEPTPPRSPWQIFYAWVLGRRRRYWASRQESLDLPVISVGNLHFGGTGKTPFVVALARALVERSLTPLVLSRGYRRRSRGPLLVSRGDGPRVSVEEAGDEPYLIASLAPGTAVAVGSKRHEAALRAIEQMPRRPDLVLLDDGFSHIRLARDEDVLLFPADDPWARGRLAPSGRLREPLSAVRHATVAVLTGAANDEEAQERLAPLLTRFGFEGAIHAALSTTRVQVDDPADTVGRALLVTGIARSHRVVDAARGHGIEIVDHLEFADHQSYDDRNLARIRDAWRRSQPCDTVLTTAKDWIKLEKPLGLPLTRLDLELEPSPALLRRLFASAFPGLW